jgi:hypothetical protein
MLDKEEKAEDNTNCIKIILNMYNDKDLEPTHGYNIVRITEIQEGIEAGYMYFKKEPLIITFFNELRTKLDRLVVTTSNEFTELSFDEFRAFVDRFLASLPQNIDKSELHLIDQTFSNIMYSFSQNTEVEFPHPYALEVISFWNDEIEIFFSEQHKRNDIVLWSAERLQEFDRAATELCQVLQTLMSSYNTVRWNRSYLDIRDERSVPEFSALSEQLTTIEHEMESHTQGFINAQIQEDIPRSAVELIVEKFKDIQPTKESVIFNCFILIANHLLRLRYVADINKRG